MHPSDIILFLNNIRTGMVLLIHAIWMQGRENMLAAFPEYDRYWQSWANAFPEAEMVFWDDMAITELLKGNVFKDVPLVLSVYNRLGNFGAKSDLARYAILFAQGGMYVDTDSECLKPFNHLLSTNHDFFVSWDDDKLALDGPSACNNHWFYAPRPLFPGLLWLLQQITATAPSRSVSGLSVLALTGPAALQKMVLRYAAVVNFLPAQSMESVRKRRFGRNLGLTGYVFHHLSYSWFTKNKRVADLIQKAHNWCVYNSIVLAISFMVIAVIVTIVCCALGAALYKQRRVKTS